MIAWFKRWRRERRIQDLRESVAHAQEWAAHYHRRAVEAGLKAMDIDMLARPHTWAAWQGDHNRFERYANTYRRDAEAAEQALREMGVAS